MPLLLPSSSHPHPYPPRNLRGGLNLPMDSPQLSNESFSDSWMINIKPSLKLTEDGHGHHSSFDGSSFIEMDPDFISMRWNDLDFSLPSTQDSSSLLVHADEIFSNGLILPLHFNNNIPSKSEVVPDTSDQTLFSRSLTVDSSKRILSRSNRYRQLKSPSSWPDFHTAQSTPFTLSPCSPLSTSKLKVPFFGTSVKSSKKVLRKYFFFFTPLYKKVKGLTQGYSKSARNGGSTSTSQSIEIFDMGAESRIYDAVLHCNKSFLSSMS